MVIRDNEPDDAEDGGVPPSPPQTLCKYWGGPWRTGSWGWGGLLRPGHEPYDEAGDSISNQRTIRPIVLTLLLLPSLQTQMANVP